MIRTLFHTLAPRLPRTVCYRQSQKYTTAAAPSFPYERVHVPVLLNEVISYLNPMDNKKYLDGTFGEGGYTKALLDHAQCTVHAVDQDPQAIAKAKQLQYLYPDRLSYSWQDFASLSPAQQYDGIVFDIGLCSSQIDDSNRGFSFQNNTDDVLDMRMAYDTQTHVEQRRLLPAHVIVNQFSGEQLADIFKRFGGEMHAKRIAAKIEQARAEKPIMTAGQLVDVIECAVPKSYIFNTPIHPATRIFQSLRVCVNGELDQLEKVVPAALEMLNVGACLAVVTFHDLEERIVTKALRKAVRIQRDKKAEIELAQRAAQNPFVSGDPFTMALLAADAGNKGENAVEDLRMYKILTKKGVVPSKEEVKANRRSRSAKLQVIKRLQ